jgi:hypothetical protein
VALIIGDEQNNPKSSSYRTRPGEEVEWLKEFGVPADLGRDRRTPISNQLFGPNPLFDRVTSCSLRRSVAVRYGLVEHAASEAIQWCKYLVNTWTFAAHNDLRA